MFYKLHKKKKKGKHFGTILNYLRDGFIVIPSDLQARKELLVEAQYYQLSGLIDLLTCQNVENCKWSWSGNCSKKVSIVDSSRNVRVNKGYKKSVWSSVLGDIGITSGRKYLEVKIIKFENPSNGWVKQNSPYTLFSL